MSVSPGGPEREHLIRTCPLPMTFTKDVLPEAYRAYIQCTSQQTTDRITYLKPDNRDFSTLRPE